MVKWEKHRLGDVIELIGGGTPKTSVPEYWNGGIPWLSVKDFNNDNRYVYETEKSITQLGLEHSSTKMLQKDDIIISARGTVGEMAMIPFPMAFNQSCYGVRGRNGLDQTFLYYLIKNCISKLKKITHGSVFDTITRDTFDNITVSVPDKGTQNKIASMLSQYDDKIELNERINDNLEFQFKHLYQHYFVDSRQSSWGMVPLSTLFSFQEGPGIRNWQYVPKNGTKFINIRCINNGDIHTETANMISNEEAKGKYAHFMLNPYDIVMSCSGTLGRYAIVQERHLPLCLNTSVIRFAPNIKTDFTYLYGYLTSKEFLRRQEEMAAGSVQQNFGPTHLKRMEICNAPPALREKFYELSMPVISKILSLRDENAKLAQLRDVLLPRLMSGEVDVSNINL